MALLQKIAIALCVLVVANAAPIENFFPPELVDCVNRLSSLANTTHRTASLSVDLKQIEDASQSTAEQEAIDYAGIDMPTLGTPEDVHLHCIRQFVWKKDMVRWEDYNITKTDIDFVNSLLASMIRPEGDEHSRSKRQYTDPSENSYSQDRFPPTGFRIRREYRRLSDGERNAFHTALQTMKTNGEYDTFAQLHRGIVTTSAHGGPNFLGWHRVYLAMFEEALRRIDGQVSLPYWDSILDNDMENPVNTILFSPAFFGNGDKQVISGPFANWVTPIGPLTRNISGQGMLFNKEHIRMIMTRCRARDIIAPAPLVFNLDIIHGGIHLWVGGQMSGLHTAAHDPVFFLHHAFVDYIWEMFRNHQFFNCAVNPSLNYPEVTGQHAPERPMDGLPGYVNIDGYQSFWTQNWYRYERAPTCPDCGSPYLTCDPVHDVCVSVERTVVQTDRGLESTQEVANLVIGQKFVGPGDDPRTQVGLARMALASRKKRAIPKQADTPKIFGGTDSNQRIVKLPLNVGEKFLLTENDNRTSIVLRRNIARGVFSGNIVHNATQDVYSGNAFPVASPMSLLPALVSDTLDLYKQNTSYYTSISAASDWLFVPVQMTYGVVGTNNTAQTPSTKCRPTSKIWTHIKVSAQGLNYLGEYTDFGVVDTSKPLPSTHAIIAIRAPEVGPSITMVTASHGCGLMCTPKCITNDAGTYQYRPCTGILWITPEDAIAYAREHTVAEESIRRGDAKFPIVFECHNKSLLPWQRLRNYEQ